MKILGIGLICFIIWGIIQLLFLKSKSEIMKKIPAILVAVFIIIIFVELLRLNNGQSVIWLSSGTSLTPDEILDTDYLLISIIFGSFLGVAITLLVYGLVNKFSKKKDKELASMTSVIDNNDFPDDPEN